MAHPDVEPNSDLGLTFCAYRVQTNAAHADVKECYEIALWETAKPKRGGTMTSNKIEKFNFCSNETKLWVRPPLI